MKDEVILATQRLGQAWKQFEEGASRAKDQLEKDGVIQRFEFTFDLLWKALKIYLEAQGLPYKTPRDSLKVAFRLGLIVDEKVFLDMLDDRNRMSHLYDGKWAEDILERIKNSYVTSIKSVLHKLELEVKKN